jgi:hypothetical protein
MLRIGLLVITGSLFFASPALAHYGHNQSTSNKPSS